MKILLEMTPNDFARLAIAAKKAKLEEAADSIELSVKEDSPEVDEKYRHACRNGCNNGDLECDADSIVSKGGDDGAYVMCWKWVSDKDAGIKGEED